MVPIIRLIRANYAPVVQSGLLIWLKPVMPGDFERKQPSSSQVAPANMQEQESTPCPWDCELTPDGVVGITDFLALLGEWALEGTPCDFGLGDKGVGISDFLALLGHWGVCQ